MRCEDVQLKLNQYWEMDEEDAERIELEAHLLECEACSNLFHFWDGSVEVDDLFSDEELTIGPSEHVNRNVMDRIYAEQSWLLPVAQKSYHFSKAFRRNLAIVIAACMAMCATAFFFFVFEKDSGSAQAQFGQVSGLIETANASGGLVIQAGFYAEVPVASISDPFVLKLVPSFPQYYIALSLLGIIMTLLILNWLSRTRN